MHERRRLERLARLLVVQPGGRQFAQLLINQRKELVSGICVACFDLGQDLRDVAHQPIRAEHSWEITYLTAQIDRQLDAGEESQILLRGRIDFHQRRGAAILNCRSK